MKGKKLIGKIHLWLGLSSGLIVAFLGITGCILAFQKEIESVTNQYQYVTASDAPVLSPSVLKEKADAALPDKHAHSVAYRKPGYAVQVSYYSLGADYYYIVYLDPYTGSVQKVKNMNDDFFRIVIMGHYYLWLPPEIGQPIVASATLIFVIMLITGIILWWPKNKAARKQRFSVKWSAKWKRVNYDLHNVLGFYATWVALFIALTGLVMGFQWFAKSVYWTASGGKQMVEFYEPVHAVGTAASTPAIDRVWHKIMAERKNAAIIDVHVPQNDSTAIEVAVNPDAGTYYKADYLYFNQYTLEEIPVTHVYGKYSEASAADKLARMNYDLHVGAYWGLPGKMLAFFASLIAGSLPITGFMIWWGRKKKKKLQPTVGLQHEAGLMQTKVSRIPEVMQ
ncbi:MAG: PepSY domain-containing protein [Chitinophagaceae bacterium]|nr:MAG: PepSY domain-containing protein [Chitinophagaceae bacterium]